jgi:hypothetical protein
MTTNEKIANKKISKWLGYETFEINENNSSLSVIQNIGTGLCARRPDGISVKLDFLHDRNQQKWIIDELIKRGYRIQIIHTEYGTSVNIWHNDDLTEYHKTNEMIDNSAFISAVEQLIDKENKEEK